MPCYRKQRLGPPGFHFRGGGSVDGAPKNWGGGSGKGLN